MRWWAFFVHFAGPSIIGFLLALGLVVSAIIGVWTAVFILSGIGGA